MSNLQEFSKNLPKRLSTPAHALVVLTGIVTELGILPEATEHVSAIHGSAEYDDFHAALVEATIVGETTRDPEAVLSTLEANLPDQA